MNYEEVFKETNELFLQILKGTTIPHHVKIKIIACNDQKEIYKISKSNPLTQYLTGIDVLITLNENIFSQLTDVQKRIVIEESLAQVYFDIDTDKLKLIKPDILTFSGIIQKYSIDSYLGLKETISAIQHQKEETVDVR